MGAIFPYTHEVSGYQVGAWGFFKKLGKFGKGVVHAIAKSPYLKAGVAGLSVVFPPAGAAGAAVIGAAMAADKVIAAAERGNADAKKLIKNTKALAKTGDKVAHRSVQILNKRAMARKALPPHQRGKVVLTPQKLLKSGVVSTHGPMPGILVLASGHQVRGHFQKVS